MNGYGTLTQAHWAEWLPQRYATIKNPDEFFTILGVEIASQIKAVHLAILATEPSDLAESDQAGWRAMARNMAEAQVMTEMAYLPPEDPDDDLPADPMSALTILADSMEQGYRDSEEEAIAEAEADYRWRRDRGLVT